MKHAFLTAACALPLLTSALHAAPADANYRAMKYGLFVHYVWGGDAYSVTINADGSKPASLDDVANRFDAKSFANDVASMGVEYVLFTAWHANMNVLYPSKVMDRWLPGHSAKRDVIGEMIQACKAKGIQVLLYTHPRDGHDFNAQDQAKTGWTKGQGSDPDWQTFNRERWNDFINEAYAELVERYGKDILGLYLDEGSGAADSYRVVDYPRLRKTITAKHPHLLMMQNDYGNLYSADLGNKEIFYNGDFGQANGDAWQSYQIPISIVTGSIFWAAFPAGKTEPAQKSDKVGFNPWIHYTPESMFRYTILQAGSNSDGGGTLWAAGPYPQGGWENGVLERMQKTAALLKPVESTVKSTYPSTSFLTPAGSKIANLSWGVATRSIDERQEFIHVLKAPADGSKSLKLPPPADGKRFSNAKLIPSGIPVTLRQDAVGIELTLPESASWNSLHTAIALTTAADSPLPNVARWKTLRTSSHRDNATHPSKAVDANPGTSWVSANDDTKPHAWLDLALPCQVSRIEILGNCTAGDRVLLANKMDFSDARPLKAQPPTADTLTIHQASYGAGATQVNVTEALRSAASSTHLNLTVSNALAGSDPAPNQPKTLTVEYSLGREIKTTQSVPENQTLTLGKPSPWVIDIPTTAKARFIKVQRGSKAQPLAIQELQVFGTF